MTAPRLFPVASGPAVSCPVRKFEAAPPATPSAGPCPHTSTGAPGPGDGQRPGRD